tara:strand:- start:1224 stop:1565 length:342 start_codon:yes stop_codon:yes gene_type:complete
MNQIVDAVACDYLLIDDMERELKKCNCLEEPIACGILFQKQHLFNIGLYDEQFLCKEEQDLMIRFKKKYNLDRLNLPLYRYRRHEGNMTNDRQMMEDHKKNLILKHGKDSIIE